MIKGTCAFAGRKDESAKADLVLSVRTRRKEKMTRDVFRKGRTSKMRERETIDVRNIESIFFARAAFKRWLGSNHHHRLIFVVPFAGRTTDNGQGDSGSDFSPAVQL